jgi:hypothetical protein
VRIFSLRSLSAGLTTRADGCIEAFMYRSELTQLEEDRKAETEPRIPWDSAWFARAQMA